MSWPVVRVGAISDQIRGVTYDKSEATKSLAPGMTPILRANNITDSGLVFEDLVYVPRRRVSSKQLLQKGDVVIAASSGSLSVVGKAARLNEPFDGSFGAFCKVLRPRDGVDPSYFAHFFQTQSYRKRISSLAAGANINNLKNEHLDELEIPLPPLVDQRRIAAILDQAEELRAKRSSAIRLLNALPSALFREWFGNPLENDRGWTQVTMSDFVAGFESGRSIVADDEDDSNSAYRVLKVSAVTSLKFRPEESKPLPSSYIPPISHQVKKGDLLFSRANTAELIGATAFVRDVPPNILLPDKLWRFCWSSEPKSHPHFVRFLFQHPSIRAEISRRASGTSGSMKNISQDKVLSISIGLPPLGIQQRFGDFVDHIEEESSRYLASLEMLNAVFIGLEHQAFTDGF